MNNGNQPINVVRGANNVPFDNDGFLESRSMVTGLTKREHFAGLAMQGILSHSFGRGNPEECAIVALQNADALLKQLEIK